jgi:hypothetical protein
MSMYTYIDVSALYYYSVLLALVRAMSAIPIALNKRTTNSTQECYPTSQNSSLSNSSANNQCYWNRNN